MSDRALPDLVSRIRLDASGLGEAISGATGLFKSFGKDAGEAVGGIGENADKGFGAFKAAGVVAIGAVIGESAKMASEFQSDTSVLVTAAGESTKNLGMIRKGILDISAETGTTWQNLTDGIYQVEKAGYRGADALQVLRTASQGAREENADLSTVTNAMTSVMASYGLKATDSVRVMNAMKTAAGESKTTMEQFSGSLSTVIPIASANGISFAEVSGALATLTQHGTSADEATQELSNTIRNLAAPNRVATTEMQNLGINVQDLQTHLGERGLSGSIDVLLEAIARSTKGGQVLLETFNQSKTAAADANQMIAAMPPNLQQLAKAYQDGTISMGDWHGALKALPADQANLAQQFATTENKAKGFTNALRSGDPAAQTFTDALKKMTGGSTGLNTVLMLSGASADSYKERIDAVSKSYNDNAKDVEGWALTQKNVSTQVGMLRGNVARLAITLGMELMPAVATALSGLNDAMRLINDHKEVFKDIGIGITAVFLPALLKVGVEGVVSLAKATAAVIFHGVSWIASGVQASLAAARIAASWFIALGPIGWVTAAIVAIGVLVYKNWDSIKKWTLEAWSAVSGAVVGAWHSITSSVSDGFNAVTSTLTNLPKIVETLVEHLFDKAVDLIADAWNTITSTVSTSVDAVGTFLENLPLYAAEAMGLMLGVLVGGAIAAVEGLWKGITDTWNAGVHFFKELPSVVNAFFVQAATWLLDKGADVLTGLWQGIHTVWDREVHFWTDLPGRIAGYFSDAINWIKGPGLLLLEGFIEGIHDKEVDLWNWTRGLPTRIAAYFSDAVNWVKGPGLRLLEGFLNGIHDKEVDIWNWAKGLPGAISGYFANAGQWLFDAGKQIIQGLVNGIGSAGNAVGDKLKGIGDSAVSAFKKGMGIFSPSRVFHALGGFLTQGLANGITAGLPVVVNAIDNLSSNLTPDISSRARFSSSLLDNRSAGTMTPAQTKTVNNTVNLPVVPYTAAQVANEAVLALARYERMTGVA